ncbi:MAG: hypothetical protein AB1486_33065 [Planctomycetota bacterium]
MAETAPQDQRQAVLRLAGAHVATAVDGALLEVDHFEVQASDIAGILHPATLDRVAFRHALLGLEPLAAGSLDLLGTPFRLCDTRALEGIRARIGWVHDPPVFLNNVPLFENIILPLRFHTRIPEKVLHSQGQDLLARLGIRETPVRIPLVYGYSLRRLAALARALLPDIRLLVIENTERTLLEPEHRAVVLEEIGRAARRGVAVVLMANYAGRLPHVCQNFLIITARGKTASGSLDELRGHASPEVRQIAARETSWRIPPEGTRT